MLNTPLEEIPTTSPAPATSMAPSAFRRLVITMRFPLLMSVLFGATMGSLCLAEGTTSIAMSLTIGVGSTLLMIAWVLVLKAYGLLDDERRTKRKVETEAEAALQAARTKHARELAEKEAARAHFQARALGEENFVTVFTRSSQRLYVPCEHPDITITIFERLRTTETRWKSGRLGQFDLPRSEDQPTSVTLGSLDVTICKKVGGKNDAKPTFLIDLHFDGLGIGDDTLLLSELCPGIVVKVGRLLIMVSGNVDDAYANVVKAKIWPGWLDQQEQLALTSKPLGPQAQA